MSKSENEWMQSTKTQYKINQDYFELGARKVKLY